MDKDLIKKYRLEETIKRFGMINEYIYETFDEAEAQEQDPTAMGGEMPAADPSMAGAAQADPSDANAEQMGDDAEMGGMPDAGAQDGQMDMMDAQGGSDAAMQPDMNAEGMPQQDAAMGGPTAADGGMMGDDSGVEPMQDGDEVIDVDDLTNTQEELGYKIDGVDDKLTKVLSIIDKFENALTANDEKINDLRNELERRNPTPTERLNIRSQAGYPFNVQPRDFWSQKSEESPQYEIDFGNDDNTTSEEREEYVLRKGDVKGGNDRSIADTFGSHKLSDFLNY